MPMLVNKLIFRIIPERSPFFIRPLLRGIFSAVDRQMLEPRLKTHAKMVRIWCLTLRFAEETTFALQIEDHLSKVDGWFAGGEEPTSADYMMSFVLEAWIGEDKTALGPKTRAYIERVHARSAF